jgi:succinate-semialdehyde dehydrogenase/glutarate-semialdehyde dehydrogenase
MPESGLLIGGSWLDDGPEHVVRDRFNSEPVASVRHAEPRHVSAAVTSAAEAAATSAMSPRDRAGILHAAAELLAKEEAKVVADYVAETGFTQADARVELERACETLHLSAEEGLRLRGEVVPIQSAPGGHNRFAFTIRTPVGVVAAIVPFNAPLNTLAHKVGPALAAGNAVVIKPAAATPLSASHV